MFAPEGGFCLYRTYISWREVKNGLYGLFEYTNFNDLSKVWQVLYGDGQYYWSFSLGKNPTTVNIATNTNYKCYKEMWFILADQ